MKKVIFCRTNGTVEVMALTETHDLRWFAERICAEYVEVVHPEGLESPYLFLCDEEGLMKDAPTLNVIGSWLYKTHEHGQPIVGDICIMREVTRGGEHDLEGLKDGEAEVMAEWLTAHAWEAHDLVTEALGID